MPRRSTEQVPEDLHLRLRARRAEIEDAVLTRVFAVSDPSEAFGFEYGEGLRAAVGTALDYGFVAIELGEDRSPPPHRRCSLKRGWQPAAMSASIRSFAATSPVTLSSLISWSRRRRKRASGPMFCNTC